MTLDWLISPDFSRQPLRVVTPKEAAAYLGVSQRTLRRMAAAQSFPPPIRFAHKTRGWFSFEVALVIDARVRGASDEQVRAVVAKIVENRLAAPIFAAPEPLFVERQRAAG